MSTFRSVIRHCGRGQGRWKAQRFDNIFDTSEPIGHDFCAGVYPSHQPYLASLFIVFNLQPTHIPSRVSENLSIRSHREWLPNASTPHWDFSLSSWILGTIAARMWRPVLPGRMTKRRMVACYLERWYEETRRRRHIVVVSCTQAIGSNYPRRILNRRI